MAWSPNAHLTLHGSGRPSALFVTRHGACVYRGCDESAGTRRVLHRDEMSTPPPLLLALLLRRRRPTAPGPPLFARTRPSLQGRGGRRQNERAGEKRAGARGSRALQDNSRHAAHAFHSFASQRPPPSPPSSNPPGMAAVASLIEWMRCRTSSFLMPAGGSARLRGGGRPAYERLSKRHSPNLPAGVRGRGGQCGALAKSESRGRWQGGLGAQHKLRRTWVSPPNRAAHRA